MGEIILKFDSVEEAEDARTALDGWKWKMVVWDLDQLLRQTVKHGVSIIDNKKEASELEIDIADKIREIIREKLNNDNLTLFL